MMRRFLGENSLGLFFGVLFLACLVGQAIAGHISYNDKQAMHGGEAISLVRYLTSSDFGQAVMDEGEGPPQMVGLLLLHLPLAAGDWIVGPRAGAVTGGMALGASVVRPLAAIAGTKVRVTKGRRRRDRQGAYRERQGQHLLTHGNLLTR
jgi:Domain of unknown function (DUF6766)